MVDLKRDVHLERLRMENREKEMDLMEKKIEMMNKLLEEKDEDLYTKTDIITKWNEELYALKREIEEHKEKYEQLEINFEKM